MNSLLTLVLLLLLKLPTPLLTTNHIWVVLLVIVSSSPTTPDDIINIVSSLKSSNSEGVDGVNVDVIKASIDLFASPLSQLCNISFSTGIVPDKLRISKVIPMFKNEDSC